MRVVFWIGAGLLALLLLLALTGSQVRLRRPVLAKECNPDCAPPSKCNPATGRCEGSASEADPIERPAPVCLPPMRGPHSDALQVGWQLERRGEPDRFERAP